MPDIQGPQGAIEDVHYEDVEEAIEAIAEGEWSDAAISVVKVILDLLK